MAWSKYSTTGASTNPRWWKFYRANGSLISINPIMKQTEVDFGSTPLASQSFAVTDTDIDTNSHITAQLAYEAPTGKDLDEVEMDMLHIIGAPAAGSMTLFIQSVDGSYLADKFKINYIIG